MGGALYRCSHRIVFATYVPVSLAVAELALEALTDLAHSKTPYAGDSKLKLRSLAQIKFGRALGIYRSANRYFYDALDEAWQRALRNEFRIETHARRSIWRVRTPCKPVQTSCVWWLKPPDRASSTRPAPSSDSLETWKCYATMVHQQQRFGSVAQVLWDAPLDYPVLLR